jgi:signal transduction histidine kinase/CheY-like chemotaxis protein
VSAGLPLTPAQVDVEFKLLHAAYVRLRLDAWMSAAAVVMFGSLMASLFPDRLMLIWGLAFAFNLTASFALTTAYGRRRSSLTESTMRFWQRALVAHLALAGLCWTVGPALMMSQATGPYVALFASILLVSCAVATISLAEQQWAMRAFLATALLPTAAVALWTGGSGMGLVAAVLVAGAVAMAVVGRGSSHATRALVETEVRLQAALTLASSAREEAEHARMQAEAASAAKTRFLANMSHELRTPLNAVIGGAELLRLEQGTGCARANDRIEFIQRSGTHLLGLIENILDLSRIEHGEMPLHPEDFDVVECLQGAVATATLLAQVKGLNMRFDVAPGLATWRHGDAQRLRQVVLNLLGNAVKFTLQGEVSLRIEAAQSHASEWLDIGVTDSGVGISEAALPHVFDPFHQADQGSDRRFGGSGLGLAIVRLWVQTMGGNVSVHSRLGEGSRFTVTLPLPVALPVAALVATPLPDAPAAVPVPASLAAAPSCVAVAQPAPAQACHVLVVEDDEINQAVVCGLLRHAGHRVSSAMNGAQALAALTESNTIHVVLMDWQMPDMDGLEVTRRLRAGQAGPAGQRVPIIALTANAFAEDRAACLAAGMNDFLSKPVLMADLLAAVVRATLVQRVAPPGVSLSANASATSVAADVRLQVYDPKVLADLPMVADGSTPEYAQELLDLFMPSASASLRAIQAAAQAADKKLMQRLLHALKSSSASVGALRLSALAAAGEAGLRRGELPEADLHARLLNSFHEFETAASLPVSV